MGHIQEAIKPGLWPNIAQLSSQRGPGVVPDRGTGFRAPSSPLAELPLQWLEEPGLAGGHFGTCRGFPEVSQGVWEQAPPRPALIDRV